jgi:methylenetetrahydrofolate dehydrogenase (NADP+)/methenyltetrahydrofolate cyclohydrolase
MVAQIISGKQLAREQQAHLAAELALLPPEQPRPHLVVLLVGEHPASLIYVNNKCKACEAVGMQASLRRFPLDISESALLEIIEGLNQDPLIHGILVQLPLPAHLSQTTILNRVAPEKDVDGLHAYNMGLSLMGSRAGFLACTPAAVLQLLQSIQCEIAGQEVVIIGASHVVGKPLALLLLAAGATVSVCQRTTRDLAAHVARADILISAAGVPGLVAAAWLKPGVVVIDVGINRLADGSIVGDVEPAAMQVASAMTPVPGGVGPVTISVLLQNTWMAYQRALNKYASKLYNS